MTSTSKTRPASPPGRPAERSAIREVCVRLVPFVALMFFITSSASAGKVDLISAYQGDPAPETA